MYNTKRIKELRENKNITQQELANILGISRSTYSMWESSNDSFPIKRLIDFGNYFNVSIDYLFNFTDIMQYPNSASIDIKKSGERLKSLRKEHKLTQVMLAKDLNIAPTMLVEYEHGNYIISLNTLYAICKKFNISADYLLGKTNEPKYLK